jgi:hypothetical protein
MESASDGSGEVGFGTRLDSHLRALAGLVAEVEPERFSGESARVLTEMFAWGERLCATGKALVARRVVDTGAWERSGQRSAAEWLGRLSGQTAGQAAGTIVTARRMRQQPEVEKAARDGRLSDQQTAAVTAAADKAPDQTGALLAKARGDSLMALRERSRQIVLAADERAERERHQAIHAGRYLRWWADDDGSGRISGRFTPDRLAVIVTALQPFQDEVFHHARAAGTRERRECHAADALVNMAQAATHRDSTTNPSCGPTAERLDDPNAAGDGPANCRPAGFDNPAGMDNGGASGGGGREMTRGSPGAAPGAGGIPPDPTPARTPGDGMHRPAQVIVRIDHAALVRGYRHADECCEIDGIGLVPVATVRAMTADAYLAAVVTDGTDIRSVVHLGRTPTALQRTALIARDPECVVPGCHVRHGLEIDHVEEWAATKITRIDSLARLCHYHHGQKTYEGWQLQGPPGRWQWHPPPGSGRDQPSPPPTGSEPHRSTAAPPRAGGSPRRAPPPRATSASVTGSLFDPSGPSI